MQGTGMARRANTLNLLATLRREWTLWTLDRDARGYTCTIYYCGPVVGSGKLMGEAIEKALTAADARRAKQRRQRNWTKGLP